jgi:predicted enzyme related to lactoylglutathione lyase
MITHNKGVSIYVDDQQRALDFYTNALGFELRHDEPMGPDARWIELAPPGGETVLVLYPKAIMSDWASRKPSLIFRCADTEATYKVFVAKGVAFTQEPRRMPWGVMALFTDPDGNEFVLV